MVVMSIEGDTPRKNKQLIEDLVAVGGFTLAEAVDAVKRHGDDSNPIAGGSRPSKLSTKAKANGTRNTKQEITLCQDRGLDVKGTMEHLDRKGRGTSARYVRRVRSENEDTKMATIVSYNYGGFDLEKEVTGLVEHGWDLYDIKHALGGDARRLKQIEKLYRGCFASGASGNLR